MDSLLGLGVLGATSEGGHDATGLLLSLLVLFAAAKIGAEVFERLRQPSVVGEILAGVLVGPQVLRWVQPTEVSFAMSELGVVFLLFLVGLETKPTELMRVGKDALLAAVGGVILPFVLGYAFTVFMGGSTITALFVGAALVATSVGITARVLARMGTLHTMSSRVVLGAAVIDDILGLLVLAVVSSFARGGSVDFSQIAITAAYALLFVAIMLWYGDRAIARVRPAIERLHIGHSMYVAAIAFCLLLAVAAGYLGVAAIIGAFLAGVAFSEVSEETGLHRWFEGLSEFFVPFFLAGIGMQLSLESLAKGQILMMCVVLTLLAIIGKVVGCGIPVLRRGRTTALQVGVGMVPRGEVGIIVAQMGLAVGVFNSDLFAVVVFMALATTMVAPPFLARLYRGEQQPPAVDEDSDATEVGIELS